MLSDEVLPVCRCWKITTKSGANYYLTSLDRSILVNGNTYHPRTGFNSASISRNAALSVDNSELDGIFGIEDDEIKPSDIIGGDLDGATIEQYLVDWATGEIITTQLSGAIGEIEHSDRIFSVEMRSLAEYLNQSNKFTVTARCPLQFGSSGFGQCNAVVGTDVLEGIYFSGFSPDSRGLYDQFRATVDRNATTMTSGAYNGFIIEIRDADGVLLETGKIKQYIYTPDYQTPTTVNPIFKLQKPLDFRPDTGMTVKVTPDCAKTIEACRRFNNLANFKGWHNLVPNKERLIEQLR